MHPIVEKLLNALQSVYLLVCQLAKKAMCFRKKKHLAEDEPFSVVVTKPGGGPSHSYNNLENPSPYRYDHPPTTAQNNQYEEQMQDWSQWGAPEATNPEENQQQDGDENQPEIDYFADMEPEVKIKKILVKKRQDQQKARSSLLDMNQDLEYSASSELDTWNEDQGWDDENADIDIDENQIQREARQQRRMERMMKTQQHNNQKLALAAARKQEKLASKLS